MSDPASSSQPIVWSLAGTGSSVDPVADRRAFNAFAVQRHAAGTRRSASGAHETPASVLADRLPLHAQLDARMQGQRPAAIKTSLPGDAAELAALTQCIDRLRAQDPLLALVVDAQLPTAAANRELLDACISELLPRATLVTLRLADAAALLGYASPASDAGIEEAAHNLQKRAGCRSVVILGGDASGVEPRGDFMLSEQARGWLLPLPAADALGRNPATARPTDVGHRAGFAASAAAAFARGFVAADALVLAKMATTHFQRRHQPADHRASPIDSADHRFALDLANLPALLPSTSEPSIRFAPLTQPQMDLYAVVDSAAWVQRVLDSGVRTVQLRIKDPAHPTLREEIRRSVMAANAVGAQLFINDHWQLAIQQHAYGVHLGQEDLALADLAALAAAGLRLGISTHAYWEVCRAAALQPSYIACGPIHPTAAKAMPWIPQGNDNLGYWCALLREPVVAIAGMDFGRAAQAVQRGADAVAVISGLTAAASPEQVVQGFTQSIARARQLTTLPPPDLPRPTLARTA